MPVIHTEELAGILQLMMLKLKNEHVNELVITDDLYRYIPTERWSSFSDDEINTGSLFDDIESLKLLLNDSTRPCSYVDFDRMASVLRAISQIRNPI